MKANELRIGNYVECKSFDKPPFKIESIYEYENLYLKGIAVNAKQTPIDVKELDPIPLDEQWLFKFGFEKFKYTDYKSYKWTIKNSKYLPDWFYFKKTNRKTNGVFTVEAFRYGKKLKRIEYVHEAQNLYFALTGEELTLND